jgi:hypothetical protein
MIVKVDKHKEKLIRAISDEITVLFEKVLVNKEINVRYDVKYNPPAETIIETKAYRVKE